MFKRLALSTELFIRESIHSLLNKFDPPLVILLYHRICNVPDDPFQLAVSPEHFSDHLRYLKENWHVVRLEDAFQQRKEPAVAITFDDGYTDNLVYALPILEACGVPATFFITTGYLDTDEGYWWDELSLYDKAADMEYHGFLKAMQPEVRNRHLAEIRRRHNSSVTCPEMNRSMTSLQLQQLAASALVDIGSHGVSHTPFSILSAKAQLNEFKDSRDHLLQLLERDISAFSYPFGGAEDIADSSSQLCRSAGYSYAVVNVPGQAHRWTNRYRLPRNIVRDWPLPVFAEMMQRFLTA